MFDRTMSSYGEKVLSVSPKATEALRHQTTNAAFSFLTPKLLLSQIHFVTLISSKFHLKCDYWLLAGPTIWCFFFFPPDWFQWNWALCYQRERPLGSSLSVWHTDAQSSVHHKPRVKVLFTLLDGELGKQLFTLFLVAQLAGIQRQHFSSPTPLWEP